jgi:ectoine hydroxylase-related dioxygenase (phytanoyl-CoA dioxygenase family)
LKSTTPEETIFNRCFLSLTADEAARQLQENGYIAIEGALRKQWIEAIEGDLRHRPIVLNTNDVGPVRWHHQTYFAHALAASRPYYELVTHKRIRDLARAYLGAEFRLKCQRYYTSGSGYELPWHTDNKTSTGKGTDVRGIGMVAYLCDTYEGELQVLRGSHKWTAETGRTEFSDATLPAEYAGSLETISARAGTLIFFDSLTLHRTRKITIDGYVRRSVFVQIDSDMAHSERTLLDPAFLDPDDRGLLTYLGLGMPAGYPVMPPSSLHSTTEHDLVNLARQSISELGRRLSRRALGAAHRLRQRKSAT